MSFATAINTFNNLRGNAFIEKAEDKTYMPPGVRNAHTYRMKTSNDELTEENIEWLLRN